MPEDPRHRRPWHRQNSTMLCKAGACAGGERTGDCTLRIDNAIRQSLAKFRKSGCEGHGQDDHNDEQAIQLLGQHMQLGGKAEQHEGKLAALRQHESCAYAFRPAETIVQCVVGGCDICAHKCTLIRLLCTGADADAAQA